MNDYVNKFEFHDTQTITLAELIDMGFFDWEQPLFDWKAQAYDDEQHSRVCEMFVSRFYWREISTTPPLQWAQMLMNRLKYELMPKYRELYKMQANDLDWFQVKDEYGKERVIESGYPETMLSGSEVYASSGNDREYEHVTQGDVMDKYFQFVEQYKAIDVMLLDELECMFSCLFTTNLNAW